MQVKYAVGRRGRRFKNRSTVGNRLRNRARGTDSVGLSLFIRELFASFPVTLISLLLCHPYRLPGDTLTSCTQQSRLPREIGRRELDACSYCISALFMNISQTKLDHVLSMNLFSWFKHSMLSFIASTRSSRDVVTMSACENENSGSISQCLRREERRVVKASF